MAEAGTGRDGAGFEPGAEAVEPNGLLARLRDTLEGERAQWFCWSPVLFGVGIGLYFGLAAEPALAVALAPLGIALALRAARPFGVPVALCACSLAVTAGFAAAKLRTEWTRAPVLEKRLNAVEVRGVVELIEPRATRGVRITMRLTALGDLPPDKVPLKARVRTLGAAPKLMPGDSIRVRATLAPPAVPVIPGGYDFARAAWFQQLGAVGYALATPVPERNHAVSAEPARRAWIQRLRQAIGARVLAVLPGETGAIANALITGERGGISEETSAAFRNSGLLHILSISGLHMVVMAGAVFYVVRFLLAAVPGVALRYPVKKWAAVLAAIAALAYLLISGAAFATVRSYIMISIAFLAVLLDRPAIALRNVAISALVILALYPESLLDAGFQMSFAAVTALVATYEVVVRRADARGAESWPLWMRPLMFFGGIGLSTLVAGLAVAPFAAYHFHTSQQFALVANLIAIPICNLVVMPAALLTLVLMPIGLEGPALWLMGAGIEAVTWCARFAAGLPGAVGHIPEMPQYAFLAMVAGGLWLCLWSTRLRFLGLSGFVIGTALAVTPDRPDVLAGRDGALMAVRGPDGRLVAAGGKQSEFELKRWLEHDGDGRTATEVLRAKGLACDASGCVAAVAGALVALARHPSALEDDCRRARILVLDFPAPRGCTGPEVIADFFKVRNEGTHAIYVEEGRLRVKTVASLRGERPWSPRGTMGERGTRARIEQAKRNPDAAIAPESKSELPRAESRQRESRAPPRPEVEDEDQGERFEDEEDAE